MEKRISIADANRQLSSLLRRVRNGESYLVTSRGQAVARIVPASNDGLTTIGGRTALLLRLGRQRVVRAKRWSREDLYQDNDELAND